MEPSDGNLVSNLDSEAAKDIPGVKTSQTSTESKDTPTSTQPDISNKFTFNKSTSNIASIFNNSEFTFGNVQPTSKATQHFVFEAPTAKSTLDKPFKFVFDQPTSGFGTDKFVFKFPTPSPLNKEFKFVAADSNVGNKKASDKAIAFNNLSQSAKVPVFSHGDVKPEVDASSTVSQVPIFSPMLSSQAPNTPIPTPQISALNMQNPAITERDITDTERERRQEADQLHKDTMIIIKEAMDHINTMNKALDIQMKTEEALDEKQKTFVGNTSSNTENASLRVLNDETMDEVHDAKMTSDKTDSTISTPNRSMDTGKIASHVDINKDAEINMLDGTATARNTAEGLVNADTSSLALDTSTIADTSINIISGERPLDISMSTNDKLDTSDKSAYLNSEMNSDDIHDVKKEITSDEYDTATSSDDGDHFKNEDAINRAPVTKTRNGTDVTVTSSDDEDLETENSANNALKNDDQMFSTFKTHASLDCESSSDDEDLDTEHNIANALNTQEINDRTKFIVEVNARNKDLSGTVLNDSEIQSRFAKFSLEPTGTTLEKFDPVFGADVIVKRGASTPVTVRHQCITNMRIYEQKSLEELRLEDYAEGRKREINAGPTEAFGDRCFEKLKQFLESRSSSVDTSNFFGDAVPTLASIFKPNDPGTTLVKYKPLVEIEMVVTSCTTRNDTVYHQCITSMKEYKNKSIEELRLEDYKAGKGRLTTGSPVSFGTTSPQGISFAGRSFVSGTEFSTAGTTLVKYIPFFGFDEVKKLDESQIVNANYQCITLMQEYENKCIEELRVEDYKAGRGRARAAGPAALFGGFEAYVHRQANPFSIVPFGIAPGTTLIKYEPVTPEYIFVPTEYVRYHCITFIKEYENKCVEELRHEDYAAGRGRRPSALCRAGPRSPSGSGTPCTFGTGVFAKSPNLAQKTREDSQRPNKTNNVTPKPRTNIFLPSNSNRRMIKPVKTGTGVVTPAQPAGTVVPSPQTARTVVPSPQPGRTIIQSPQPGRTIIQSPQPGRTIIQSSQPGRTIIQSPQPSRTIIQSPQPGRTIIQSPQPSRTIIQSPQPSRTIIQSPQPSRTVVPSPQPSRTVVPSPQPSRTIVPSQQLPTVPNTPRPRAQGGNLTSLRFHAMAGSNIVLHEDRTMARMMTSHRLRNAAYSERPIAVGEEVCFRLVDLLDGVPGFGTVSFGFAYHDPVDMCFIYKTFSDAFQTVTLDTIYSEKNNIVYFYVNSAGEVHYGINGRYVGVLFDGVNTRQPVWAMIELQKPATVQLVAHPSPLAETRGIQPSEPVRQDASQSPLRQTQNTSINSQPTRQQTRNTSTNSQTARQHSLNTSTQSQPIRQPSQMPQTPGTQSHDTLPLNLHAIKGANVQISSGVISRTQPDIPQAYVFTAVPMCPGQTIAVQILSTTPMTECPENLAYGLTSCDPSTIRPSELPDEAYFLHDRPEYWTVHKAEGLTIFDQMTFTLTTDGRVQERRNDSDPRTVMHVDATQTLWAFVNICGAVQKVRLLACTGDPILPQLPRQPESPVSLNPECPVSSPNPEGSNEEHDSPESECKVCFDNTVNSVLYMCGHMCMCYECAIQLRHDDGKCPICRAIIADVIRTFRS